MLKRIDSAIFEVTTSCNLNCIHCGYKNIPNFFFDTNKAIEIIDELIELGLQTIMLTGGEPFLYKDIFKILGYAKEKKLQTKIATNGTLLQQAAIMSNTQLIDELVISLDASNEETYKKIRNVSGFNDIIESIVKWSNKKTIIVVSFLLQKNNYLNLIDFLNLCEKLKVNKISILVPNVNGDFTNTLELNRYKQDVFLNRYEIEVFKENIMPQFIQFYNDNTQLFRFGKKHLSVLYEYITKGNSQQIFHIRQTICSLPLKTIFLYANGDIKLCPYSSLVYNDFDSFIKSIDVLRTQFLFNANKHTNCRQCLETPLDLSNDSYLM